jgi:virginiamycin B lyase
MSPTSYQAAPPRVREANLIGGPGGTSSGRLSRYHLWMRALLAGILLLAASSGGAQVITEFPIPTAASSPYSIAAGPDGNLWFTESDGNRIGRISTAGVVTEFPLPNAGSDPRGITAGPDAALWFTEFAGNRIGRITISGAVTEFPLTPPSGSPISIVTGSDDALWFTESNGIGRMTTDGGFSEIPLPDGCFGLPIGTAPDGSLRTTCAIHQTVLRISTAGVVTSFPEHMGMGAGGIATGPDGDVWLTVKDGLLPLVWTNELRRQTAAGTSDGNVDVSAGGPSQLGGIAAGADGNMWFTATSQPSTTRPAAVWRSTPGFTLTEFPLPSAQGTPTGIAAGSDGALWFTEMDANNIGRITTGVTAAGASFFPVAPCRLGDTRLPNSPIGSSLHANRSRAMTVAGQCGIPASALAISVNLTATRSNSDGHLVLFGGVGAGPLPPTSVLNYRAGQTRANNAIVPLGPAQTFFVFCGQPFGSSELTLDVTGYFQ